MDSVFQDLKRAREAKHLSISDVSDVTLINIRFLEAIEEGRTDILPQTYVRAFIREYANCVGLDPADIMKRYDAPGTPPLATEPEPEQPAPPSPRIEPITAEPSPAAVPKPVSSSRFVLPILLLIIVTVVIWNLKRPSPQESIRENPIELAATAAPKETTTATATQPVKLTDSLTLAATVSESVWVQIVIDDRSPQQYLFRPSRRITWRARDRFRLSTGNAGALDLTLNDKRLGVPGKRGAILRGVEYNRQTLQQK
jgi:hypothetical protein